MHKLSDRSAPFGTYRNLWKDSTRMRTKCFDNNEDVINDQKHTFFKNILFINLMINFSEKFFVHNKKKTTYLKVYMKIDVKGLDDYMQRNQCLMYYQVVRAAVTLFIQMINNQLFCLFYVHLFYLTGTNYSIKKKLNLSKIYLKISNLNKHYL